MDPELNDYINVYSKSVYEYINEISKISSKPDVKSVGLRAITHVFQLNYVQTKSLIASYNSCKQASAFYLEYVEQMARNNNMNINYDETSIFLYNKLILDTSIITRGIDYPISRISKLVYIILWLDNPNINQLDIPYDVIINFACLFKIECLVTYFEVAQGREMNATEYSVFLTETYKIIKTNEDLPDNDTLIINYGYKRNKWDEHKTMPIKKWCKWLLLLVTD